MTDVVIYDPRKPKPRVGAVLLSGLDSAAALHWALDRFAPVVAIGFDYGQAVAELSASQTIAERRGVRWVRESIIGIGQRSPDAGREASGVSRAFVPARNGLFAWRAANIVARMFPGQQVSIVLGCNADDAAGFPDCRANFIRNLSYNIGEGLAGSVDVDVRAPWIDYFDPTKSMHKGAIVRWVSDRPTPDALEDVRFSVSCYRGTRCGACDACTIRARAFSEAGIEDGNEVVTAPCGGDPAREARP